jgi:hypothetical protein
MKIFDSIQIIFNILLLLSGGSCTDAKNNNASGNHPQHKREALVFLRVNEPAENAFTFLLPKGWTISGGITRVDPNAAGGTGNAIEAKLYMRLASPDNKASISWLPDTRFFDIRRYGNNPAAPMFPDGSNDKPRDTQSANQQQYSNSDSA